MNRIGDLAELAEVVMGQSPAAAVVNRQGMGLPLLNGPTEFTDLFPVPAQWTTAATKRARAGDTLFCVRGSTTGRMNIADQPYCIGRGLAAIRARDDADATFVYYAMCHALPGLLAGVTGSVFPNLSSKQVAAAQVAIPPAGHRRAIAEVLGALDDKIAANAAVVQGCDQLRRLKYEALVGPEVPLSSLARFVNGRAYTKGATGSGRVVIRIAELNSGLGGSTVYNDIEVPEDNLAREGDLLFAWSGSLTVARWYRPEAIVNQHIFKVVPLGDWPTWLVASATERKLEDFKAIAADKATTMGHIQRHHLDQLVGVPSWRVIATSHEAMQSLWDRALAAEVESLRLAELRDTLLPHLVSGRLSVREAEKQVEEVL